MLKPYNKNRVMAYMKAWAHKFETPTELAENAVWDLDLDDSILDDEQHEVWDLALKFVSVD